MYVWQAAGFFVPYVVSAIVLATLFGFALSAQFKRDGDKWPRGTPVVRATTFFAMYAIFGVAVAYFLSLGLKEDETDLANPLVQQFATPLVALLTAGVTYVAKQQAPSDATGNGEASKGVATIVAAGVTCFLIESILCYRALYLQYLNT